jgi:hypothetical protein
VLARPSYAPRVPDLVDGDDGGSPEWVMPPPMLGGHVTGPRLIARSDGFVLAIRQVLAFPVGVEVEVEAHGRAAPDARVLPALASADLTSHPRLRFRVEFADGRAADQDDDLGLRHGLGPMLTLTGYSGSSGGPGAAEDVRMTLWLWPLPPPGPVTLECLHPHRDLDHAVVVMDGAEIRAAAARAQGFWPSSR